MSALIAGPQEMASGGVPMVPRAGRFRGSWNLRLQVKADYTFLGYHVTCIPDAMYPWTEGDVRFIREHYDPQFVPIFRRMTYRTAAGGIKDFIHHGVARYDPEAKSDPLVMRLDMPTGRYGASFRHPNIVERWFENKAAVRPYSQRSLYQLPPPTIHWGSWVTSWAADSFWDASWEDKLAFHRQKEQEDIEARHHAREHEEKEAEYRAKGEENYQSRQFDDIGSYERNEIIGRQTGQWKEPTRPSVDMGTIPRDRFTGETKE